MQFETMEEEEIVDFLKKPDFTQRFLNYNDSRKWVSTLQRKNAIRAADSQAIQSKHTSEEANDCLLTLLLQDPSLGKLTALSEALKEDETHNNQQKLAKKIDHFLKSEVSSERKRHDAGLQKYDITADSCLRAMQWTLAKHPVSSAKDLMKSLYFFTYSLIVALFTEGHLDKIKGQALRIIDRGDSFRVEGKEKSVFMAAESVEKVLDYLGVPNMWDDLQLFVYILLPLKNCDPSCYKEAMGNLDHYKQHFFQYQKVRDMVKNTKALRGPEKTPGQDQVEVQFTVEMNIFQLQYSTCNELLTVILAEGTGIPREKIECGTVQPGSSIITFYIPKQYIKSVSKTFYKGAVIWAMLELRVTRIEILGHFHFDVNWNTAVLPIRDSLLSNGDLFRNTKILPKAFQAIVDLMPPLPGKKGLPLQKYQPQLLSDSFSDVLLFTQEDKPKWWDDKKLPVSKTELEMEATELKEKIKKMEDLHHHTMVELHSFKVKLSNERAQVENLQSQLTKTEKTLLRERNEIERIKELDLLEKVTSLESQLKDSEKAKGEVESLVKEDKLLEKENDELKSRIDHYLKEMSSLERQVTSKEKDIKETKNELETAKVISKREAGTGKTASPVQPPPSVEYASMSDESGFEITSVCQTPLSQPIEPTENEFESEPLRARRMSLPNIEINTDVLKEIAEELTGSEYDWKMLACELELEVERICKIEKDFKKESDRNFQVLTSWQKNALQNHDPGYSNQLCQVLTDLKYKNIAKLVPKCQPSRVPISAKTGPASSSSEKKLTLSMLSKAAKRLCTKPWDVFKLELNIDQTDIYRIEAQYPLNGVQKNKDFTRVFWALVKWKEYESRKCHDFDRLLNKLGHGALATEILGTPVYPPKTHETQRDYVDEGLLTCSKGQEMVDLAKLNKIAKAVFALKSNKRGTCFFIDYENSIYLITACHTFLTGSFEEGDYETIRNAVSTAKVIVENREEDIKKHYPERTFFYNDLIAIKVSGTELPASCRPIKIKSSVKDDLVNENCFLSILHLPYNEVKKFNYGMVVSKQSIKDVTILNYYLDTADGSSGAPVLLAHCDDGVPEAEYHVVGVHKGKTKNKDYNTGLSLSGLLCQLK